MNIKCYYFFVKSYHMFSLDSHDVNSEQEAAILHDGSVLLTACPGSWKTRTVAYKIAYELSMLTSKKKRVIAITYTNTAADEIKERIELLWVDTRQLWIGTIHAFCLEWILRPYSLYVEELKFGFKVLNSYDSEDIITELCKSQIGIKYYDFHLTATSDGFRLVNTDPKKQKTLEKVLEQYQKTLIDNHQIDFEWILHYSFKILNENPIICATLSNLFPWILIDEYQDTKEIQYQILARILKAGSCKTRLFIVGDPNQAIFDSLGGYPMPKEEIERISGLSITPHVLSNNYRSSSVIIDYFSNYKTFPVNAVPAWKYKDVSSIITFNDTIDSEKLCEEISKLIVFNISNGISPNEICILGPWWIHLWAIARTLMAKLPDYSFDWPWMSPISRDIDNFWYKISRVALTEPSPNLYIRRLRWAQEIIQELLNIWVSIWNMDSKGFLRMCNSVHIAEGDGLVYLGAFFSEFCTRTSIDIDVYPLLREHYDSFFASAEARIDKLKIENPCIGDMESFRKVFKQRSGITVSTMHWAKGTEYDVVIAFWLLQWIVPHFSDNRGWENAKKMLYVIASRARKNLHLISEIREDGRGVCRLPTEVLKRYQYNYHTSIIE